ncbi:hypothetical protein [Flavobacterium sp. 102]|uniref:hypothetical protein n=1 Tax=Flavobacterium sp. 102 TaxID=2135623 RepID=UPI000EB00F83|nr:hypothetical protein [Flavobacterium sp. 102]RKS01694.1 hypothetical protein C8C84_1372 [Flavobacterium sp. 102]
MYHNYLISKNHPQQAELEKAVGLVMAFSAVSSIYFSPHIEEDLNAGIIMVIIAEDSPHAWDDLNENYWKVFEAFPQFSFRIFSAQWVRDELKDGNPFFAMHCTKNSLIYSTEESEEFNFVERLKPKRFLKKAKSEFDKEDNSAFILGLNLKYYQRQEDYLQAAYNIHQNIRWLLIAASNFLTGEYLVEHDLEVHQNHVGKFSKELAKTFDIQNEQEKKLLELLNIACDAVQYGHEIPELTKDIIDTAEAKKDWLNIEVSRLFKECVCRCQYEFARTKTPLITIEQDEPLKLITQIVAESVEISALYCIGQRNVSRSAANVLLENNAVDFQNTHYYLFLIVKDFQAHVPGNISFNVRAQTDGRCTTTVIMHSKKSLYQQKGDQQHFFYQIMQRGQLLFQETLKPVFLPFEEIPIRNIPKAKIYWQQRDRTKNFLMEAEAMDGGGATKIHVYLMQLVIEQTCLGLIRIFLGYMPNHFSLPYLFELCEYFTPMTAEIFPRKTDKDRELLRILSGRTTSLRYGPVDDVAYHDYEVLSNRYNEFVERADKLAAAELERLEPIKEDNDQND